MNELFQKSLRESLYVHYPLKPEQDRSIEGKKTWDDSNNADRLRPVSIQEWTVYFIHGTGDHECKRIYRKHQRVRNRIH